MVYPSEAVRNPPSGTAELDDKRPPPSPSFHNLEEEEEEDDIIINEIALQIYREDMADEVSISSSYSSSSSSRQGQGQQQKEYLLPLPHVVDEGKEEGSTTHHYKEDDGNGREENKKNFFSISPPSSSFPFKGEKHRKILQKVVEQQQSIWDALTREEHCPHGEGEEDLPPRSLRLSERATTCFMCLEQIISTTQHEEMGSEETKNYHNEVKREALEAESVLLALLGHGTRRVVHQQQSDNTNDIDIDSSSVSTNDFPHSTLCSRLCDVLTRWWLSTTAFLSRIFSPTSPSSPIYCGKMGAPNVSALYVPRCTATLTEEDSRCDVCQIHAHDHCWYDFCARSGFVRQTNGTLEDVLNGYPVSSSVFITTGKPAPSSSSSSSSSSASRGGEEEKDPEDPECPEGLKDADGIIFSPNTVVRVRRTHRGSPPVFQVFRVRCPICRDEINTDLWPGVDQSYLKDGATTLAVPATIPRPPRNEDGGVSTRRRTHYFAAGGGGAA